VNFTVIDYHRHQDLIGALGQEERVEDAFTVSFWMWLYRVRALLTS